MRGRGAAEFERRSVLYAALDAELRDRTRFFAAAALVNTVFARLARASIAGGCLSGRVRAAVEFLREAGALLEAANLGHLGGIGACVPGRPLDHALVRAEQRLLTQQLLHHQANRPQEWPGIHRQLNALLNDGVAAGVSRWCLGADTLSGIIGHARRRAGRDLDFAAESHRVHIGVMLVDHIRARSSTF